MLETRSRIISISKRFFLFRLLARLWWVVDLLSFFFAPVVFCCVFAAVHLVIYRFYYLSFSSLCACFVYPENENAAHD